MKECIYCQTMKSLDDFPTKKDSRTNMSYKGNKCTECVRIYAQKYYQDNYTKTRQPIGDAYGRTCSQCGEYKPWSEFNKRNDTSTGFRSDCRACSRIRGRSLKSQRILLERSGWSPEMKEVVINIQGGLCANIGCYNLATHADHDHDTGEARAVLCLGCNSALGLLNEDMERISGLLDYARQCNNVKISWEIN